MRDKIFYRTLAAISTVGIVIIAGALLPDVLNKGNKIFAPNSNTEKNTQSLNTGDEGDLIGADITGPSGGTTTGNVYDAWCGKDYSECTVEFKDNRLSVNGGLGIKRSQMVNVIRERICRQYFLGIKDCFESNYNKEYTITYKNKNEELRSAFITIKHEPTYEKFNRDFQIWLGDVLREIGPSLQIEK